MKVLEAGYDKHSVRAGVWADKSPFHNHGVVSGAKIVKLGEIYGYEFDGIHNVVNFGDDKSLDAAERVTIATGVNVREYGDYQQVFGKGFEKTANYMFELVNDNGIRVTIGNGSNYTAWGWAKPPVGEWHFIVGTFEKVDSTHTYVRIYMDDKFISGVKQDLAITLSSIILTAGLTDYGSHGFRGALIAPVVDMDVWTIDKVRKEYYASPIYKLQRGI